MLPDFSGLDHSHLVFLSLEEGEEREEEVNAFEPS